MKIFRKLTPKVVMSFLKNTKLVQSVIRVYFLDSLLYYKYHRNKKTQFSKIKLESLILYHTHSIEKGLTNIKFRVGFGRYAITNLIRYLQLYEKLKYPTNCTAYLSGVTVLRAYKNLHMTFGYEDVSINDYLSTLNEIILNNHIEAGVFYHSNTYHADSQFDFYNFAKNRKSVRDFGDEKILDSVIEKSIEAASFTPSVCNRQPWGTKVVTTKSKIDEIFQLQKGFNNYGNNTSGIIVIYTETEAMLSINERNQHFIDGGMYSMSILYALNSYNVAACALNAALDHKTENEIKRICKIPKSSKIVIFIAYGSYPSNYKTCVSSRKSHFETNEFI